MESRTNTIGAPRTARGLSNRTSLSRDGAPFQDTRAGASPATRVLATLMFAGAVACSSTPAEPPAGASATSTGSTTGAGGNHEGGSGGGGGDAGGGGSQGHALSLSPGLVPRFELRHPGGSPHLGEMVVSQDLVYLANSFEGVAVHRAEVDQTLSVASAQVDDPSPRCTTIALHEASHTLFCGSEMSNDIAAFDLTDPAHPVLRTAATLGAQGVNVGDLHVDGDTLYLARFEKGLWTAKIAGDGALGGLTDTGVEGNARLVSGAGGRLVLATRDRGLVTLTASGGAVVEDGQLATEGPPIQLGVHGARAVVALGSGGVLVVDVSGAPSVVTALQPPGVATSADFEGDVLAVTTLAGVFVYDLAEQPPRAIGFAPTSSVMLDVRFVEGDVVTSDFWFTERFAVKQTGNVTNLDMPRGIHFAPGSDVVVPFRNAGKLPLRVKLELGDADQGDLVVPPGETGHMTLPAAVLGAAVSPGNWTAYALATTLRPTTQEALADPKSSGWKSWDQRFISLVARPSDESPAAGRPAVGDAFPVLTLAGKTDEVFTVPLASARQRLVFFSKDCAAMWPELQDAAWLASTNRLDEGAQPIFINRETLEFDGFAARWGFDGAMMGYYGAGAPAQVTAANSQWGEETYESGFQLGTMPSGADHPTDYLLDATGKVEAVERVYYGASPLR